MPHLTATDLDNLITSVLAKDEYKTKISAFMKVYWKESNSLVNSALLKEILNLLDMKGQLYNDDLVFVHILLSQNYKFGLALPLAHYIRHIAVDLATWVFNNRELSDATNMVISKLLTTDFSLLVYHAVTRYPLPTWALSNFEKNAAKPNVPVTERVGYKNLELNRLSLVLFKNQIPTTKLAASVVNIYIRTLLDNDDVTENALILEEYLDLIEASTGKLPKAAQHKLLASYCIVPSSINFKIRTYNKELLIKISKVHQVGIEAGYNWAPSMATVSAHNADPYLIGSVLLFLLEVLTTNLSAHDCPLIIPELLPFYKQQFEDIIAHQNSIPDSIPDKNLSVVHLVTKRLALYNRNN